MHKVGAKQLIAIALMVLVAISGAGLSSAAQGSCQVDAPSIANHAVTDRECAKNLSTEDTAESKGISCLSYASSGASSVSVSISNRSPSLVMSEPYLQLLPKRLDKPPRL